MRGGGRKHEYPWEKKKLPNMFSYESPSFIGDRPVIWARKVQQGWYVQFADKEHGLAASGTNRDRAAKELLRLLAEKQAA